MNKKKKNGEKESKYAYKRKNGWTTLEKKHKKIYDFCDEYKKFLNDAKTEREAIQQIKKVVDKKNRDIKINNETSAAIIAKGKKPVEEGLKIVISHVDSPRLDLKQIPLFEDNDSNLALFETHYYGGIKKFHWVTIPLALHGIVVKENGEKIDFRLGDKKDDPWFSVPDLLPHLSHEVQNTKKMNKAIKGESLDIIVGSKPIQNEEIKEKIKAAVLEKLHKDYGLIEEDFISAELEAIPAYSSRDIGFDRSMVGGYGQDDRVCVFSALKAILDINKPDYTAVSLFVDKEEIGSEGNSSAQVTTFLRSIIKELDSDADVDKVMLNSKVVSADVNAAVTPNYTQVFELKNASSLGRGVVISKYTGHGGKYAANDAKAEYVAEIRNMLNQNDIPWQTGELGKVDKGGGGTVAKYLSRLGMNVIDLGPSVMSMHAPFEVTSKVDVYSTYLAYKTFLQK
ncbi:MAG: aminopeptidase [Candidatus Thermoplasmatota archaeon]